ncbi:adenosylcobinamide-phosphate synthase CbiB [Dongia deserti]|uniref:adenosylcobinamide-phosphate synthase CbiB n=1 Tax=Dongia deserti TaxID=2268030 RepID=UPI000E64FEC1|nr:adenosylcobinamide-phosphate synthase CbiB [Dongia deserti]
MFLFARPESLLLALALDAVFGDPEALNRRQLHPIQLIGRVIAWADARFNLESDTPGRRRNRGAWTIAALLLAALIFGHLIQEVLLALPLGWLWLALVMSTLIAQRSLYDHVAAVASGLETGGIGGGRLAVSRIVGRDPEALDQAGVSRAAIESLAENFSDGVVAPVFWAALFGLPGLLAYKVINTADSMIGHKTPRHLQFGWAAARLDDLLNLVPARLSGLIVCLAAMLLPGANPRSAWRAMRRDANKHRSPNAGWPEAAFAGALGLAIAGPRVYHGKLVEDHWMNDGGRPHAAAPDIRLALRLFVRACIVQAALLIALIWLFD